MLPSRLALARLRPLSLCLVSPVSLLFEAALHLVACCLRRAKGSLYSLSRANSLLRPAALGIRGGERLVPQLKRRGGVRL